MELTGAQALMRSLEMSGVDVMFGLPGGAILPVYDPVLDSSIRHVLVRHEQGAGHMAQGYAHVTGRPGVAMVTSGPAATNIVTPLCDAFMDSIPLVVVTGQVAMSAIGSDAFQECDTTGITMAVTKHNYLVTEAADIPRIVAEAFHIATTGRPGPVLIDLPKDVSNEMMTWYWPDSVDLPGYRPRSEVDPAAIAEAAALIRTAQRPVIYAGGGLLKARAAEALRELAEMCDIHVVTTLMARGVFPDRHRLCLGMPGMHGNYSAVTAMQQADLLINLGARFDDRVTGNPAHFAPGAKVIHVDIDPAEHGKVRVPDVAIAGDARVAVEALIAALRPADGTDVTDAMADRSVWKSTISGWQEQFPLSYDQPSSGHPLKPQYVVEQLRDNTPDDTIVVAGVGQHQMWASQYWKFDHPYTWVNSGGLGTMGFAVAGCHRCQGGPARPHRVGHRWRRLFPDDCAGADFRKRREHPGEGGHPQQRLPRHGASMAGALLRRALQPSVPQRRSPRLRGLGRGHGLRRHPGGISLRSGARNHQGELDQRPPRGDRLPGRYRGEGVPDGASRRLQRRHHPGA